MVAKTLYILFLLYMCITDCTENPVLTALSRTQYSHYTALLTVMSNWTFVTVYCLVQLTEQSQVDELKTSSY